MNELFQKMIADKKKKAGKSMSKNHMEAKGSVLNDLMDHLGASGAETLKGLKKVTVASNSKEGLEKGLDKAKELASSADLEEGSEHESQGEGIEPETEVSEEGNDGSLESDVNDNDPESLKAEIERLKSLLASKKV